MRGGGRSECRVDLAGQLALLPDRSGGVDEGLQLAGRAAVPGRVPNSTTSAHSRSFNAASWMSAVAAACAVVRSTLGEIRLPALNLLGSRPFLGNFGLTMPRWWSNLVCVVSGLRIESTATGATSGGRYAGFTAVVKCLQDLVAEHAKLGHTRIPGERDLSIQLGIGRQLVREALRALEAAGLIYAKRNAGWYLADSIPKGASLPTLHETGSVVSAETLLSFLSFRLLVEPGLAAWAATHADDDDVAALQASVVADPFENSDLPGSGASFHAAVVAASKNTHAIAVFNSSDLFVYWTGIALSLKAHDSRIEHDREHHAILRAILEADQEKARSLTERHIRRSIALIRSSGQLSSLY